MNDTEELPEVVCHLSQAEFFVSCLVPGALSPRPEAPRMPPCCRRILTMAIAVIIMMIMKTKESMPTKELNSRTPVLLFSSLSLSRSAKPLFKANNH